MDRRTFLAAAAALPLARRTSAAAIGDGDYRRYDAVGLAELVARRQASPEELLDAALARLHAVNPRINAVIAEFADQARADIGRGLPAGPLRGVPFLVKDWRLDWAGTRSTGAARLLKDAPPAARDSALAAAYRAAGLVVFGKTNLPEFGIDATTEPLLYGPTRNPWDLARSAGGSSGGAAAAVAAGMVPAAHGNDGGGSLRIPAAACGVFALKVSRGRISMAPDGEGWGGMSTQGVVSRSVRDTAVLLDVASGPVPGDPYWLAPPERPFATQIEAPPPPLRIAVSTASFHGGSLDPECAAAVRGGGLLCATLGHKVEEATPDLDFAAMRAATATIVACNVATLLAALGKSRGRAVAADEVEPGTWWLAERGRATPAPDYVAALQHLHRFTRGMADFFSRYDVLLTSTLGSPAVPLGSLSGDDPDITRRIWHWVPNTNVFNATGQPAMTVPLAQSKAGLPIGLQFAARSGEDGLLLRLAAQIEHVQPWKDRLPSL